MDKAAVKNLFALEDVLSSLLEGQKQLGGLLERQRGALAAGDAPRLAELCREEQACIDRVRGLEARRTELLQKLSASVNPDAAAGAEPLRLSELAQKVPEPVRSRLLVRRAELVKVMTEVQRATAVVRRASEALLRHVGGLIGTLGHAAQGGGGYSPAGRAVAAPVRLSTINLSA